MSVFSNFVGTMKEFFRIGGPSGPGVKRNADELEIRNSGDTAYANLRAAQASGSVDEQVVNWKDARDFNPLISFSFDGASAPAAGTNTGKYGFCHTSGGSYTAGQVYYDNGTSLEAIKVFVGMRIFTTTAINGTVSLIANGVYAAEAATAPYSWTLKGGSGDTGTEKVIGIDIGTNSSYTSTTNIPEDAVIMNIFLGITTEYDNNATIAVVLDGNTDQTLMDTDENDPSVAAAYYGQSGHKVTSDTEGPVRVDVSGSPTVGEGTVYVEYSEAVQG